MCLVKLGTSDLTVTDYHQDTCLDVAVKPCTHWRQSLLLPLR